MLISIAILCALCEAIFTALEVALGAVSRGRLRAIEQGTHVHSGSAAEARAEARELQKLENDNAHNGEHHSSTPEYSGRAESAPPSGNRRRARRVLNLLERPDRLTLLFITVTSLSLWGAASLLTWQALAENWPLWILPLALVGVLFVAEVLPLLIAARHAEFIALRGALLMEAGMTILSPLLWLVGNTGHGVARLLGVGDKVTTHVTEGELRTALAAAEEEGVIESEERAMIEGAMDFREKLVREVMTPRLDIIGISAEATLPQALDIAMSEGHSRLPVYEGTLDRIVGVISAKDLIPHLQHHRNVGALETTELTARAVVRPAFYVPENKRIASTLEELRHQRLLMAIVVDADGATAGLVTLEDLLEEIVGEIQDEYDTEEPPLRILSRTPQAIAPDGEEDSSIMNAVAVPAEQDQPASRNVVACDATVTVRDFERFWQRSFGDTAQLSVAGEDADPSISLAALALQLFESVPQPGDRVTAGSVRGSTKSSQPRIELEVMAMDGPRIEELKMTEIPAPADE